MKKALLFAVLLFCASAAHAQAWSNIFTGGTAPRAIDWSHAGLPVTLPDGEATNVDGAGVRLPPTRTQCGSTVAAGTSDTSIQTLVNGCANGTYLLLGPGAFHFTNGVTLCDINSMTLRGSGAGGSNATIVYLSGSSEIAEGCASGAGQASWSGGYTQASTSITLSSASGLGLTVGNLIRLSQCNTGLSGSSCATGTQTDNGGVFICASPSAACSQQTSENNTGAQSQTVLVTNISGTCTSSCTVTISPGLYMPNWASGNTPTAGWQSQSYIATGVGLEDMQIVVCESSSQPGCTAANTSANPSAVYVQQGYASWMKGVKIVGQGPNDTFYAQFDKNCLFMNNYIFSDLNIDGADGGNIGFGKTSDNLFLNNIGEFGFFDEGTGGQEGDVLAYNYSINGNTGYIQSSSFQHQAGSAFILHEGNDLGVLEDDDTWGTHDFNTQERNHIRCWDPPFTTTGSPRDILEDSFSRFANLIGNAADGGNGTCTVYLSTVSAPLSQTYEFGFYSNDPPSDTLTQQSAMMWGNCDVVNATCRFNSAEVPTSLSGNAAPYENSVPGSHTLPCSFFLSGYSPTSCASHPSGGTGLSFWKVCTSWTTFPTSCSGTQLQPFPAVGPDVTGGPYVNGNAYDNAARVAYNSLPPDVSFQTGYTITGSSWSSGVESLTVTGIPNVHHVMGRFQISGGACATSGAGTGAGAEVAITAASGTGPYTVKYALASNPGTCTGTMLFPDVRQFDERVYEADNSSQASNPSCTPTSGVVPQTVTCTNPNSGTTVMCYAVSPTVPATNGAGTGCTTGTQYTTALSIVSAETLEVIAGTSTLSDSSVVSYTYTAGSSVGSSITKNTATASGVVFK